MDKNGKVGYNNSGNVVVRSTASLRKSLMDIRNQKAWLSATRASMLARVPKPGDYANFPSGKVSVRDLAYLSAATGHEFAILSGKKEDILFHGTKRQCLFPEELGECLITHRLRIKAHSHPGEIIPEASIEDRDTLRRIGQKTSIIVSGISGEEITFSSSVFDDL